jgi:hypothetical protein
MDTQLVDNPHSKPSTARHLKTSKRKDRSKDGKREKEFKKIIVVFHIKTIVRESSQT